ncbi:hypothetical protein [Mesorhizobium amorphae]|uniref:hypothetical protein n=1 Tax=Mesorhizobium amorphae TaxID=71433 RepID=UPI0011126C8F|nr:hypothetical protein [Mesorhizobium amorphae]
MPQKTLADTLAARGTVYVNSGHPMCCKSTKLDLGALIEKLGPDHGSMHQDLVGLFGCSTCKAAGATGGRRSSHAFPTTPASNVSGTATGNRLSSETKADPAEARTRAENMHGDSVRWAEQKFASLVENAGRMPLCPYPFPAKP